VLRETAKHDKGEEERKGLIGEWHLKRGERDKDRDRDRDGGEREKRVLNVSMGLGARWTTRKEAT
jgi:hypothetical protein